MTTLVEVFSPIIAVGLGSILEMLRRIRNDNRRHDKAHVYTWAGLLALADESYDTRRRVHDTEIKQGLHPRSPRPDASDRIKLLLRDLDYDDMIENLLLRNERH